MKYLNFFTQDYKQKNTIKLSDGTNFVFILEYSDQNMGWYFGIEYGDTKVYNIRLCTISNILSKWKNIFKFGISCVTDDYSEPWLLQDLENGRVMLYLLEGDEINEI